MPQIRYQPLDAFYHDFLPLIAEIECGRHYDAQNPQHVAWLKGRLANLYASGGQAICLYAEDDKPLGFLFLVHDKGLEGADCFGKKADIAMFGLFKEYRSQGLGVLLIEEAWKYVKEHGGDYIYVNTYEANQGAIRFYVRCGFVPVALHPGENGRGDLGQVYLYKDVESS
jgi:ribosomal protein S18 acetylase RimI-like enzyme